MDNKENYLLSENHLNEVVGGVINVRTIRQILDSFSVARRGLEINGLWSCPEIRESIASTFILEIKETLKSELCTHFSYRDDIFREIKILGNMPLVNGDCIEFHPSNGGLIVKYNGPVIRECIPILKRSELATQGIRQAMR